MQQTIVSVVFPLTASNAVLLQDRLESLRTRLGGGVDDFATLRANLPMLHFLSMVVFDETASVPAGGAPVAPMFVLEANTDGAPGPFWAALEALIGEDLRDMLRLCAPPLGEGDTLFRAVTAAGARVPVAPLLERQSVFPEAAHAGNRGLSRTRILCHDELFQSAQALLPPPAEILDGGAGAIHAWLRARLLPRFDWLSQPWTPPISREDMSADWRALLIFAACALGAAALPWLVLGAAVGPAPSCAAALLTGLASLLFLPDLGDLTSLLGRAPYRALPFAIGVGLLAALLLPVSVARHGLAAWVALAVCGMLASVLVLLAALRRAERRDPVPADSVPSPELVSALRSWEDCHSGGPDHMASLVIIKPGWLRWLLIRVGMRALTLAVRATSTDGYLGSMRTIHFAHWAIVDGGRRLLFLSNFDGSWESYLDDFIEKAHAGLTLAWGNCIGFPPPEYLSLGGAAQGRKFKAWARCSMTPSRFWYAAYPALTVNQIVRQAAIARGLCQPVLSAEEAVSWARNL